MNTKLTLRLDEKLIKDTKKIASARDISLSQMVADYFMSISPQKKKEIIESPVLSEVSGILTSKSDKGKLLKKYRKHVEEKYL